MKEKTKITGNTPSEPNGERAGQPLLSACLRLTWKVRKNDGYSCENLYISKNMMKIAGYHRKLINDPDGQYRMEIYLPAFKKGYETFSFNDKDEAKARCEEMVKHWFESALNCR